MTMRWPQIQRTERTPRVVPTPRIEPVMAWVVEIGMSPKVAPMMVVAAAGSAQKPPTGWRRVMPEPIVLTMRHPPNIVPRAMAAWQERMIRQADVVRQWPRCNWPQCVQSPCARLAAWPAAVSSRTMMPIVFWASLPPWPRL